MSKLLKAGGVVGAVIFAAYFLLIDSLLKSQLERRGTAALQAPLFIGDVTFHLLPTSLTLRDVRIGNPRLPTHDLVQAEELSLPLSLRELLAHKLIVDTVDVRGLRFHRPRSPQPEAAPATANSPQLYAALQRAQQMLDHPLASNTIDPQISLSGILFAEQFKPLLTQLSTALRALTATPRDLDDWQLLLRRVNLDGAFEFGNGSVRFIGTLENFTPQPALFDVVTHLDVHSAEGETAALLVSGSLDNRKLAQAAMRVDLKHFPLARWTLSDDPQLRIQLTGADATIQAMLSLTGNQLDFNALIQLQQARFDTAHGSNAIARTVADVWRRAREFDVHLQASGDSAAPVLKMNSSLDLPLATALQQLRPAALAPASAFPATP